MAPDEAGALRHVITRFLGQPGGCPFDVSTHALPPGAGLLLCTDGVTNVVDPQRLAALARPGAAGRGRRRGRSGWWRWWRRWTGRTTPRSSWPGQRAPGHGGALGAPEAPAEDPFRLRQLLERERPRGRRGLTRGALLALLGAAGVGAAGYWLAPRLEETIRRPFRPPPDAAAGAYLAGVDGGRPGRPLPRLTPEAQRTYSEEAFSALHRQAGAEMTLQSLRLTLKGVDATGGEGTPGLGGGRLGWRAGRCAGRRAVRGGVRHGALRRAAPGERAPAGLAGRGVAGGLDAGGAAAGPGRGAHPARLRRRRRAGGSAGRAGRPLATGSGRAGRGPRGAGRRQYPQGTLAGPLTGYVGEVTADGTGGACWRRRAPRRSGGEGGAGVDRGDAPGGAAGGPADGAGAQRGDRQHPLLDARRGRGRRCA